MAENTERFLGMDDGYKAYGNSKSSDCLVVGALTIGGAAEIYYGAKFYHHKMHTTTAHPDKPATVLENMCHNAKDIGASFTALLLAASVVGATACVTLKRARRDFMN